MSIELVTPQAVIDEYIDERIDDILEEVIQTMSYIGESALRKARERGSYTDRTGNLRSSTGYVLAVDGKIVTSQGFGKEDGLQYARELALGAPESIVLVVVAGMSYATYVSDRGYDVLDSAELEAERLADQLLKTE